MSYRIAHTQPPQARAAIGFRALVHTMARPLLVGLLLGLLLVYYNVVAGSVQRGEQLKRQLADAANLCDTAATRLRPMTCIKPADATALRSAPVQPHRLAAR